MQIESIPVSKLKPYGKNTRKHKDLDVDNIVKSIQKYGFNDPIGVWSDKNIIVEGHGRLLAAKKLDMKEVPCIRLDHLTDEQRREYAIAHNATAELSIWDKDFLAEELESLDLSDFDFDFNIDIEDDVDFDESDLDLEIQKTNVIVSLNCANVDDYESIKERLQNLANEVNATLAVKMA